MGAARIWVTFELLRECLHLPPETEIHLCGMGELHHTAELTVTHPDLKDVPRKLGELPPIVTPSFRRQEPVVFVEWGQERETVTS